MVAMDTCGGEGEWAVWMVYKRSKVRETAYTAQETAVTFARRKREGNIAIDLELTGISIRTSMLVTLTAVSSRWLLSLRKSLLGGATVLRLTSSTMIATLHAPWGTLRAEVMRTENRWGSVITHSLSPAKVVHGSATKATRSVVPQRQHVDDTVAEEKRDGGGGTMVVKFIVEKVGLDCRLFFLASMSSACHRPHLRAATLLGTSGSACSNGPIPSQEQILNGWLRISRASARCLCCLMSYRHCSYLKAVGTGHFALRWFYWGNQSVFLGLIEVNRRLIWAYIIYIPS
ncbi:hypothetical protein B0H14DRAFT_3155390 [Mycena olivaceomarginata]|nr:hypothetical protein B0H14DRAFT_3155390 [Mycena olivaceomarginata]